MSGRAQSGTARSGDVRFGVARPLYLRKLKWLDLTPKTMAATRARLLCRALPCRWWPILEMPGASMCLRCGVSK